MIYKDRPYLFGTNWKMRNVTSEEALQYARILRQAVERTGSVQAFVFPPATLIQTMAKEAENSPLFIGAQNFHWAPEGEYTGELSTELLRRAGANILLVGHAERRTLFQESNQIINQKLYRALSEGVPAVFCVGEQDDTTTQNELFRLLSDQILSGLEGITVAPDHRLVVGYEPAWAIGIKAHAAAPVDRVTVAVRIIRQILRERFGGADVPVIYGGSVNRENARSLFHSTGVNGLFVGRAAADPDRFADLIQSVVGS
jgi:L-erythrulose 1-phosphate isomerase